MQFVRGLDETTVPEVRLTRARFATQDDVNRIVPQSQEQFRRGFFSAYSVSAMCR